MSTIFDYNKKTFKEFSRFYEKAPVKARRATARMLSVFAFGTKEEAFREIRRTMTIRSERFVKTSLRYKGARATNIDSQRSSAFSIERDRFTGWKEQNEGSPDKRTRSQSLLSRGRSFNKRVRPSARMKPGRSFIDENDFDDLPSGNKKVPAMIARVKLKHKNKPFIIKRKYKSIKRGLYKFIRNKMMILQNFEKKKTTVKRNPWMMNARRNYFKRADISKEWGKSIEFRTKKRRF